MKLAQRWELCSDDVDKGRATAEAARLCLLTVETAVQYRVTSSVVRRGRSGTGAVFLRFLQFFPVNHQSIIPPLLCIHLSPPHEVCDSPDKAAHYHTLGPKLEAVSLTWHLPVSE
jgi:hypothetical protein